MGTNNITGGQGERYFVEKAIIHPKFDMTNFLNDITLLRTKEPIKLRKTNSAYKVNTVCLPPYHSKKVSYPSNVAVVAGWGTTRAGSDQISTQLLKVSVNLVNHQKCKNLYANVHHLFMSDHTLCYGQSQKDSCQGDSGGPLVNMVGSQTYTVGIVSFGAGCGTNPGVYTEVAKYINWIGENVY